MYPWEINVTNLRNHQLIKSQFLVNVSKTFNRLQTSWYDKIITGSVVATTYWWNTCEYNFKICKRNTCSFLVFTNIYMFMWKLVYFEYDWNFSHTAEKMPHTQARPSVNSNTIFYEQLSLQLKTTRDKSMTTSSLENLVKWVGGKTGQATARQQQQQVVLHPGAWPVLLLSLVLCSVWEIHFLLLSCLIPG